MQFRVAFKRNLKYLRFYLMCFKILLLEWYNVVKLDNKLITKSTKAIDLLKEKRTALISAAVTGKIDVRDENREDTVKCE